MSDRERLINEWVRKADNDLRVAKRIADEDDPEVDIVYFLCQQSVEKYFKAILIFFDQEVPRVHDLTMLSELIQAIRPGWIHEEMNLRLLSRGAVDYRYPGTAATLEDANMAITTAVTYRDRARKELSITDLFN